MSSQAPSRLAVFLRFALLSLLSAFLLFQVQPIISKFILPWFGGSPGVWTTCMLFFQVVLCGGYAYAHALSGLDPRRRAWVHTLLVLGALATLPIAPGDGWKPTGSEDPAGRILLLLLATVALPYFVLSSTSPLTQVWFTRAGGGQPWRLYALSNVGSLAALLTYPFFFEPRWDVKAQTWMWSAGFAAFALLSVIGVWRDRSVPEPAAASPEGGTTGGGVAEGRPRWWQRLLWVLLPALASMVLLAATNHVCQDVAVIPFLWVAPLSLYLLTFIICFEHERWYKPVPWALAAIVALALAATYHHLGEDLNLVLEKLATLWGAASPGLAETLRGMKGEWDPTYRQELVICFAAVFLACMVCHGELARRKPAARHLTEYYMLMSFGGALGGALVSLAAPRVFDAHFEWPIGLIAVCLVSLAVLLGSVWMLRSRLLRLGFLFLLPLLTVPALLYMGQRGFFLDERIERVRNFYGVLSVDEGWDDAGQASWRSLYHGGIMHGMQDLDPAVREEPESYYGRHTGIGRALDRLKDRPDARVGIVGMGTATAACYGQKGHVFRFYEINPDIIRLARSYFYYLSDMENRGGTVEIAHGDARLNLEREPPQKFDVLLLDAFSGDAIPVHLLTKQAFEIYRRHMKPDGIIAVHVTNRYLNLASVVNKIAVELGMGTTRIGTDRDGDHEITDYVLVTNDQAFLQANPRTSPFDEVEFDVPLWTDTRHNLFEILEREKDDEEVKKAGDATEE